MSVTGATKFGVRRSECVRATVFGAGRLLNVFCQREAVSFYFQEKNAFKNY